MIQYGWQIDPEAWAQVPHDISESKQWKHVSFTENDSAGVDDKPGIYFICTTPVGRRRAVSTSPNDLFSMLFTPIYIGKTENLRRRFVDHCRRPSKRVEAARICFKSSLQFWFHALPTERINLEEARLIKCFGPTANERDEKIMAKVGAPIPVGIRT